MPRLCAFGCAPSGARMHCFPNLSKYPERFKTWVYLVGGKLETASDYEFYKKKRICDLHFTPQDRNRYNRLNALAVPSLHIPVQSARGSISVPEPAINAGELPLLALNIVPSASGSNTVPEPAISAGGPPLPLNIVPSATAVTPAPDILTNVGLSSLSLDKGAAVVKEHNYSIISRPSYMKRTHNVRKTPVYRTQTKTLHTKIKYLRSEISRLRKKQGNFKERLANAEKLTITTSFEQVVKNMTTPAKLFVHMQLQSAKKSKGRRFTIQEKVLSLSLYKRSPKCYSLLHKYFTLPSVKAMKRLLCQIKLGPGINTIIFEKIKKTVMKMDIEDRLCSLIFDEMSLTAQVFYNTQKDALEGFTTNDEDQKFADHALVFMIKSIKLNFKQPIAYYFTNSLSKLELKKMIKLVIKSAQDAGLVIVNTVCDQSTVNVSAITELVNDSKQFYFRHEMEWRHDLIYINGQNIIPIYDAPRLIKGIRNNLLSKDLRYTINDEEKLVKWEYFEMVYRADKTYGELRLLDKITEEHINPEKINKMKVKLATQLFSHSVAVVTEHLTARGDLPQECRHLIDFTLLMNNLFDSLNVSTFHIPDGKRFKGPIKRLSPHHQLWQDAKAFLKTIKFIEKRKIGDKIRLIEKTVPSVTNLIKTIEGMQAIWKTLSEKYRFDAMLTRNLNQDPVENFFGNIRSYGARNIAPNSVAFEGAFKALLLNNYNSPHSIRANCEKDNNECLQTLDFFLTEKQEVSDVSNQEKIDFNSDVLNIHNYETTDAGQRNYVCGWVLTKCLKRIVKSCQHCRQTLLDLNDSNTKNAFIKAKEYSKKKWLCYPSSELDKCFQELQNITISIMSKNAPKKNIKKTILSFADLLVEYPFKCPIHKDLKTFFENITINVILHSWCRSINRILSGKLSYSGDDEIKISAQQYYNKHKHYKNKK